MLFHPIWKSKLDKMVVLQPVTFRTKEFNLHKILRAIDSNVILSKLKPITAGHQKQWFH
jgi:DNA polymerase-3 subunit alpha/error-prone DNA polymerase